MDYRVLSYLGVITIATAILFGLTPALRLARMDVNSALKDGTRGAGGSIRGRYLSGVLVVVETTLAVVLLTGAGLMMRSFVMAYTRPAGVDTVNILTMRLDLPVTKYAKPSDQLEFARRLREQLRSLPGVEDAVLTSGLQGSGFSAPYELEGQPADAQHRPSTGFFVASEGYFETLRLASRRGRVLTASDHQPGPYVAVVNEALVRQIWPNQDPLGKRFRMVRSGKPGEWMTIVGVIPNVLQNSQRADPDPTAIIPFRQEVRPWMTVMARTRVDAATLGTAFRRAVQTIDPDLPVRDVTTLDNQIALSRWPLRVFGSMFAIFGGIALLLATVGLYAVVAYGVNQRTQEIGLRVALGAAPSGILRMILSGGMRQAGLGLLLGLAAAFGVTRVLSNLLVGVSPTDPVTFGLVAGLLITAATLGCAIPARRAMRVDPAIALRHE